MSDRRRSQAEAERYHLRPHCPPDCSGTWPNCLHESEVEKAERAAYWKGFGYARGATPPPLDASDPGLRIGMGGRLPGPSQASLGSPEVQPWDQLRQAILRGDIPSASFDPDAPPGERFGLSDEAKARWGIDPDDDTAARRKAALQRRGQG